VREFDLIDWLRSRAAGGPGVVVGIGDDAAVIGAGPDGRSVVTTDLLLEATHFLAGDDPFDVGHKAMAVSVSDIAAMGCRPVAGFLAVGLRRDLGEAFAKRLFEGALALCATAGVTLAGGDTTESRGGTVVCSTVVGFVPAGGAPVLRSGARPGEAVFVTGRLGGSLSGRHLRFTPRNAEALVLVAGGPVGAMIDLSDGLSSDAGHLARESRARIVLEAARIPVSEAARTAADGRSALSHALDDGEDFELLFTAPPERASGLEQDGLAGTQVTRIGQVKTGEPGVFLIDEAGREEPLRAGGFEHFR
jgi:thiamine-monophosphate kinase